MLVNGIHAPYHEVATCFYRLRLLNSSNARNLKLSLSDNSPFYVVGSDGGLLERPYEASLVTLSPAERADLLVDFGRDEIDDSVRLEAHIRNGMGGMMNEGGGMMQRDKGKI